MLVTSVMHSTYAYEFKERFFIRVFKKPPLKKMQIYTALTDWQTHPEIVAPSAIDSKYVYSKYLKTDKHYLF